MTTLRLIFNRALGQVTEDICSRRFEQLLKACNAIEHQTPGDGWRLRLNGKTSEIHGPRPGEWVSIGTIDKTHKFLQGAGLTPDTIGKFLV